MILLVSSCKPKAQVVEVESGIEADIFSDSNFTLDFGEKVIGGTYYGIITLTNSGKFSATDMSLTKFKEADLLKYSGGSFPGTNGTCGTELSSGKKCKIEFEFSPDIEKSYNYTVDINYKSGIEPKTKKLLVSAYAGTAPFLKFDNTSDFDFGIHEVGDTVERTYSVMNMGGLDAKEILAAPLESPFSYKGGSFPGIGGTCSTILKAYSSCSIVVEMMDPVNEPAYKALSISYSNTTTTTNLTANLQVLIVSIEADLAVMSSGVQDFKSTTLEKGVTKKFKIANQGYLKATALTFLGSSNFSMSSNTCNGEVAKSSFCEFYVTFNPLVDGSINENFVINYFSGKGNKSLNLAVKGVGIAPALLAFDPLNIYSYGNQAINSEKILSFTVKNTGNYTATSLNVSLSSTDFVIANNGCMSLLYKLASCTVEVKFYPSVGGSVSSDLIFTYNNGSKTVALTHSLSGQASAQGFLKFSNLIDPQTFYSFDPVVVGQPRIERMLVTNTGLGSASNVRGKYLDILDPRFTYNGNYDPRQIHSSISEFKLCSGNLEDGDICYHHDSTYGDELIFNMAAGSTAVVDGTPYSFCSSSSPGVLCRLTWGANANVFIYPGMRVLTDYPSCGETINAGATCQIVFSLKPASADSIQGTMELNYISDNLVQTGTQSVDYYYTAINEGKINYAVDGTGILASDFASSGWTYPDPTNVLGLAPVTLSLTNNGGAKATISSISWLDAAQTNFTFDNANHASSAPGVLSNGGAATCSIGLQLMSGQSCSIAVWFNPQSVGASLTDKIRVVYNSGSTNITNDLVFNASSDNLAVFQVTPTPVALFNGQYGVNFPIVSIQNSGTNIANEISLKNIGNNSFKVTDVKLCKGALAKNASLCSDNSSKDFIDGSFNTASSGTCYNQTTNVSASCKLQILYSPQAARTNNDYTMIVSYTSNGRSLKKNFYGTLDSAVPVVLNFPESSPHDYGLVETTVISPTDISITNQSTQLDATSVTYSLIANTSSYFSIDSSNTSCISALVKNSNCKIRVNFTPLAVGVFTAKLQASYNNGKTTATTTIDLKGTGEPPHSVHKGWSTIYAIGNKVNISNVSDGGRSVELAWNTMVPTSGTITGYNIYRRLGDEFYGGGSFDDYSTPLNGGTPIAITNRRYVDSSNLIPGSVYYYEVRPIIAGFPSRCLEAIRQVRVIVPPDNMVFIHRWMANLVTCQKLGSAIEVNTNNQCAFGGIGSKFGKFDLGYDLLVDRFELGADKSSRYGQLPIKTSQAGALSLCDLQGDFTFTNVSKTASSKTARKRILKRLEFEIAGSWGSSDNDTTIVDKEQNKCNSVGNVKNSGSNGLCKSQFGIEDAVGNEWEWVSDRLLNGVGITDQNNSDAGYELRLDPDNKDLSGVDFNDVIPTLQYALPLKDSECFSVPLALPIALDITQGTCVKSKTSSATGSSYFHGNNYFAQNYTDMQGLISGGGSYVNQSSGLYSSFWVPLNTSVGSRCAIKISF